MERSKKAWINALFFAVTLVFNGLGAAGLINGLSQKEISDKYITLITPSPSTFSIWSLIYTLLLFSIIFMILKKNDRYYQEAVDRISLLFRISCLFNILWIVTFSFLFIELSSLFIIGFLVILSLICRELLKIQEGRRWLLPLTFSLYTGWLMIATVVNIAASLVKMNWDGFGLSLELWAILILSVAVLLTGGVAYRLSNAAIPLPVAWAYFGIYRFLMAPEGFQGKYPMAQTAAITGAALLIALAAIQCYRNRFNILPNVEKNLE